MLGVLQELHGLLAVVLLVLEELGSMLLAGLSVMLGDVAWSQLQSRLLRSKGLLVLGFLLLLGLLDESLHLLVCGLDALEVRERCNVTEKEVSAAVSYSGTALHLAMF